MNSSVATVSAGPSVGLGIATRIAAIQARFTVADDASADVPLLGSSTEFDPFGDVYQQALEAIETTPAGTSQFGTTQFDSSASSGLSSPLSSIASISPISSAASFSPSLSVSSSIGSPPVAGTAPTADQLGAAIAGVAGPPGLRPNTGYGSMPVPAEVAVYGNGRLPTAVLQSLATQPNHRLLPPAAAAWDGLVAAAAADGINLRITDSYRNYDQQVDTAERKGLYSQGGLAATPGTSNHGWGLAVDADVTDSTTRHWLEVNGPRYGWVNANPRENWHYEFRPNQV